MVEASIQMCICEVIVGVVLATQMDAATGALSRAATIGLIVVVSALSVHCALMYSAAASSWMPQAASKFRAAGGTRI